MRQRIVAQGKCLEIGQSSQLRRKLLQAVVAQVQMQQVGAGHEQLAGDDLQVVVRQVEHEKGLCSANSFRNFRQIVVR